MNNVKLPDSSRQELRNVVSTLDNITDHELLDSVGYEH